jgi:hypothetical protein
VEVTLFDEENVIPPDVDFSLIVPKGVDVSLDVWGCRLNGELPNKGVADDDAKGIAGVEMTPVEIANGDAKLGDAIAFDIGPNGLFEVAEPKFAVTGVDVGLLVLNPSTFPEVLPVSPKTPLFPAKDVDEPETLPNPGGTTLLLALNKGAVGWETFWLLLKGFVDADCWPNEMEVFEPKGCVFTALLPNPELDDDPNRGAEEIAGVPKDAPPNVTLDGDWVVDPKFCVLVVWEPKKDDPPTLLVADGGGALEGLFPKKPDDVTKDALELFADAVPKTGAIEEAPNDGCGDENVDAPKGCTGPVVLFAPNAPAAGVAFDPNPKPPPIVEKLLVADCGNGAAPKPPPLPNVAGCCWLDEPYGDDPKLLNPDIVITIKSLLRGYCRCNSLCDSRTSLISIIQPHTLALAFFSMLKQSIMKRYLFISTTKQKLIGVLENI